MQQSNNASMAVIIGRFQPFHSGHNYIFETMKWKGIDRVCVFLGEMQLQKGDIFDYTERMLFFKKYLLDKFKEWYIFPMKDYPVNDTKWAREILHRVRSKTKTPLEKIIIIKPMKHIDINKNGEHYLDIFESMDIKTLPMAATEISSTHIRERPHLYDFHVHPHIRKLFMKRIGGNENNN